MGEETACKKCKSTIYEIHPKSGMCPICHSHSSKNAGNGSKIASSIIKRHLKLGLINKKGENK